MEPSDDVQMVFPQLASAVVGEVKIEIVNEPELRADEPEPEETEEN